MAKVERIYTIPLGDAYEAPRNKRGPKAVRLLKEFISRHMKAEGGQVFLSEALNGYIWKKSIQKPPRRVKVRLIKEDGTVRAYLADEKIEEPKKEEKPAEKKEEKKPEEPKKKEEAKEEEKKPEAKVEKKEEAKKESKKEEKKPEEPKKKEEKPEAKKEPTVEKK